MSSTPVKLLAFHFLLYSRVPRPPPNDARHYTVEDFNVGRELTMYGRVFMLTSCDEFTRNFLTKLGVRVPPPLEAPADPYSDHRKAVSSSIDSIKSFSILFYRSDRACVYICLSLS